MSCGVGCGHCSDLALLWLWCRPAAIALIGLLAWEPPYAMDVALKRPKQKSNYNCLGICPEVGLLNHMATLFLRVFFLVLFFDF